jgi:hypothetical protein
MLTCNGALLIEPWPPCAPHLWCRNGPPRSCVHERPPRHITRPAPVRHRSAFRQTGFSTVPPLRRRSSAAPNRPRANQHLQNGTRTRFQVTSTFSLDHYFTHLTASYTWHEVDDPRRPWTLPKTIFPNTNKQRYICAEMELAEGIKHCTRNIEIAEDIKHCTPNSTYYHQ